MMHLSLLLYRHSPDCPIFGMVEPREYQGYDFCFYTVRPLRVLAPHECLQTLWLEFVGFSWVLQKWCMMQGYGGLGAGVPVRIHVPCSIG